MFELNYVRDEDKPYWRTLDKKLGEAELDLKIRDKRGYVLWADGVPVGVMRYNLFWDIFPFLNLISLEEAHQGKGFGRQAMAAWEEEMRKLGYPMVMLSTQVDEGAQHFYRKLGYLDKGSLFFDGTPHKQAQELFMIKVFS